MPCVKTAKTYKKFWNTINKYITIIRSATWSKGYLFSNIESDKVFQFKILKNFDGKKAPGIDDLSGIFF